jgi:hypothetical protein
MYPREMFTVMVRALCNRGDDRPRTPTQAPTLPVSHCIFTPNSRLQFVQLLSPWRYRVALYPRCRLINIMRTAVAFVARVGAAYLAVATLYCWLVLMFITGPVRVGMHHLMQHTISSSSTSLGDYLISTFRCVLAAIYPRRL